MVTILIENWFHDLENMTCRYKTNNIIVVLKKCKNFFDKEGYQTEFEFYDKW
jgi:hypothetical protein